jgi:hypothetical protein
MIQWPQNALRSGVTSSARHALRPQSEDPLSVQFCQEVNDASALLDFLIREGHPYRVPDQIIERIEAARTLVVQAGPPPADERAKLLEAFRDLVAIPGTSVLFDFPPTPFSQSRWRRLFLIFAVGLPILFILISLFYCPWEEYRYHAVVFGLVSALVIWALYAFTGIVTNHKLNHIIAFCYLFTIVVLAASILPWWVPRLFSEQGHSTPAGILRGCALDAPNESYVSCGDKKDKYQWVLNIGGATEDAKPKTASLTDGAGAAAQKAETSAVYLVRGGLVVPLYVIILSLIGGAVSMTRRVPEYQRRAMSSQDPLTNQQARESFVFQIMQVASAPLIAVAAYYIVNPTTIVTSVVLGFGSGFASEPILLMIRGLVDKLSPGEAPRPSGVTVRVDPPTKDLKPGESHQFTAHVSGASSADVMWLIVPPDVGWISPSGYYTAPKEGGKTVTVTASSVADKTKTGSASVTIKQAEGNRAPPAAPAGGGGDEQKR